jgi:hypothetical protein
VRPGGPPADNYGGAQRGILEEIRSGAEFDLPAELRPPPWPEAGDESTLKVALTAWARACPLPLVLFFDEIDALGSASLISVLSQLRAGYNRRQPRSHLGGALRDAGRARL